MWTGHSCFTNPTRLADVVVDLHLENAHHGRRAGLTGSRINDAIGVSLLPRQAGSGCRCKASAGAVGPPVHSVMARQLTTSGSPPCTF